MQFENSLFVLLNKQQIARAYLIRHAKDYRHPSSVQFFNNIFPIDDRENVFGKLRISGYLYYKEKKTCIFVCNE